MTTETPAGPAVPLYPVGPDEAERLAALVATGLLDTLPESQYDDIVALAALICNAPLATVTLMDRDRQWFKARTGIAAQETPRSDAFCNYPIAERRTCVVPDASVDPRFSMNVLVVGEPHLRFYAGAPLITSHGHALGTLCVLDTKPRQITSDQVRALEALARQVVRAIQMRENLEKMRHLMVERDRAQEAIRASEARLQYALDATHEGVWDWNLVTGQIIHSARCFEQIGYPAPAVQTPVTLDAWRALCHPDDFAEGMRQLELHLAGNASEFAFEHRSMHRDGHYVWILSRGKVVTHNLEGRPVRMVGTTLDITQRKQAEQELRDAKEEAQNASASKSQFLANMSHEIRTPLTAILGFTELLEEPNLPRADQLTFIQTIRRNGRHLVTLINDILDLSKIEADRMQIEQSLCPLEPLVADCIALIRGRAAEKNLSVSVDYQQPVPRAIISDPTRLRQVLINLLGNAVKFTKAGSVRVVVRAESVADDKRIIFEIIDTGIGLSPDQLSSLFTPFMQADAGTTRKFGGTGLGLVISRRLARILGGDITVESAIGKGSRFILSMPLREAVEGVLQSRPAASPLAIAAAAPPITGSILFAEDGRDNQILIGHVLQNAGARVTLADDGRAAVDKVLAAHAAGNPFDLILMDMQMPELDGYDASRLLRKKGIGTPIIALTASAMAGDRDRCLAAGCTDFATKPIDVPGLLSILRANIPAEKGRA